MSETDACERMLQSIRSHKNSKLENQRLPAILLHSIDNYIDSKSLQRTASVYFSALLALIKQSNGFDYSSIYILSIVMPATPSDEKLLHIDLLYTQIVPYLQKNNDDAPTIRCALNCTQEFLLSFSNESKELYLKAVDVVMPLLVKFSVDLRPKVRKISIQVLQTLKQKYDGLLPHLYPAIFDELQRSLSEVSNMDNPSFSKGLHTLHLLECLVDINQASGSDLGIICNALSRILTSNIPTSEPIFEMSINLILKVLSERIDALSDAVIYELCDSLIPYWYRALSVTLLLYDNFVNRNPSRGIKGIQTLLEKILDFCISPLQSSESDVEYDGATSSDILNSLKFLRNKFTMKFVNKQNWATVLSNGIKKLIKTITASSRHANYAKALPRCSVYLQLLLGAIPEDQISELLPAFSVVARAIIKNKLVETPECLDLFKIFIQKLASPTFLECLGFADNFCNIQKSHWLPEVFRDNITGETPETFFDCFLPTIEAGNSQWWELLPLYTKAGCITNNLNENALKKLASAIYNDRSCHSHVAQAFVDLTKIENVRQLISSNSSNLIGVFGNTLATMKNDDSNAEDLVMAATSIFSVAGDQQLQIITNLCESAPLSEPSLGSTGVIKLFPALLSISPADTWKPFLPHLVKLFDIAIPSNLSQSLSVLNFGPGLAYRLLQATLSNERMISAIVPVISRLYDSMNSVGDGSQALPKYVALERLKTWKLLFKLLPNDEFHLLPSAIAEVVLFSKHHDDDLRAMAFELLVEVGNRMKNGGKINMSLIDGEEPNKTVVEANINEYISMISANLMNDSLNLKVSTIFALTRIFYEFSDYIDDDYVNAVLEEVQSSLQSNNQEIARAAVGFIKMYITSFTKSKVLFHLDTLLPLILRWIKEHNAYVKLKAKQLLDRMLRVFSLKELEAFAENETDKEWLQRIWRVRRSRGDKKVVDNKRDASDSEDLAIKNPMNKKAKVGKVDFRKHEKKLNKASMHRDKFSTGMHTSKRVQKKN